MLRGSQGKLLFGMLTLTLMGLFMRFYQLPHQSYWMDEGYTINAVLSISEHGDSILDSGMSYFCPIYCYPTAFVAGLFGDSPFSYRFLAAIFGTLFIVVMFFITRRLFSVHIALITSFFITFSYWQIAWSRQARWYTLFTLLFWLALYFFYQTLYKEKGRKAHLILTVITTLLAILTHGLGYLLPFIFLGWFLVDQLFIQKKVNCKKITLTLSAIASLFFVLVVVLKNALFATLFTKLHFYYELPYYLSFYFRNYWLFIILALFAVSIRDTKYKRSIYFLIFVFLSYLIPLSFLTNIVHYRYLFHVTPVFFMISAVSIIAIIEAIPKTWLKYTFSASVLMLFFTLGGGVALPTNTYYLESDDPTTLKNRPHYAYTPQPDWNSAYAFIKKERAPEDLIISSHPHFNKIFLGEPGYWLAYNYLGLDDRTEYRTGDNREYYVGAQVLDDVTALQEVTADKHGFIVYDFMAADGRLSPELLTYIATHFELAYTKQENAHSEIWVYRF